MYLLNPGWLVWAIPIIACLLAVYLRRGKNVRKIVGSLFFIQQLKTNKSNSRKKFFLPPRAILEILLLTLLLLALAGIGVNNKSEQLTIVIDNSLSMLARSNPQDLASESLLQVAKKEAISNINYFSAHSEVAVWITSPRAENITDGFTDSSNAIAKINSVQGSYAQEKIENILDKLRGKTLVFSDFNKVTQQSHSGNNPEISFVDFSANKKSRENIAVETAKIDTLTDKIYVSLKAYTVNTSSCQLKISQLTKSLNWQEIALQKVLIKPETDNEFYIDLPADSGKVLKIQLTGCSKNEVNSLAEDDTLWLSAQNSNNKINIVSDFELSQLNLTQLDDFNFSHIKPANWTKTVQGPTIFHRFIPQQMPMNDSVFIYPADSRSWLPSVQNQSSVELIDWDKSNPILRYLSFPSLKADKPKIFNSIPAWAQSLLKSSEGDIVIYGSKDSKNYLAIGFEILPFSGKQNLPISILTLNIFNYLISNQNSNDNNSLSFSFQEEIQEGSVIESALKQDVVNLSDDKKRMIVNSPGLFRLGFSKSNIFQSVKLFFANESDLLSPKNIQMPLTETDSEAGATKSSSNMENWIIMTIMAILIADLLNLLLRRGINA